MDNLYSSVETLNLGGKLMDISTPKIMGVLNVTPDSFFDGGRYAQEDEVEGQLDTMLAQGIDILDVGSYSSRPGAEDIMIDEEIKRLDVALKLIQEREVRIPVSVDTFRSEVADYALSNYSVDMINDISGGEADAKMYDVVAKHKAAYVLMHMKGNPQTMVAMSNYDDLLSEMLSYFVTKIEVLKAKGVNDIVIDPGFGFAKDLDQNYYLLDSLSVFKSLGLPILVGVSRKSMIYRLLDVTPDEALNGTTIVNTMALERGASLLRVHDVKEAKECIGIYKKLQSFS